MSEQSFDAKGWVAIAAPAIGLQVAPAWRDAVAMHMGLVAAAAAQFADFPLDIVRDEPAPVFRPEGAR